MIRPLFLTLCWLCVALTVLGQRSPRADSVSTTAKVKSMAQGIWDGLTGKDTTEVDTSSVLDDFRAGYSESVAKQEGRMVGYVFSVPTTGDFSEAKWRFQPGDQVGWANPAYDDRRWSALVSPEKALLRNETLWKQQKGWFRLRFKLPKKLLSNQPTLVITQIGRSEIYLDGKLLATLGTSAMDTSGSQEVVRYLPLPLADTNAHLLAVRYRFRQDPVPTVNFDEAAFTMKVDSADSAPVSSKMSSLLRGLRTGFMGGIFAILTLLHFLFYRANRRQGINKLLGWEMLAFTVGSLTKPASQYAETLTINSVLDAVSEVAILTGMILLLTAIYQHLQKKRGTIYYTVVGIQVAVLVYELFVSSETYGAPTVAFLILIAEYVRVSWQGRKQGTTEARLPWVSIRTTLYCFLVLLTVGITVGVLSAISEENVSIVIRINEGWMAWVLLLVLVVMQLSLPVGLSLTLVLDYARTYRQLGEKQALLARQNETLEAQVRERTAELSQSLTDLKATQQQLIQREKLASLGELTAGVAHEIQNPLNFVNNFSEVSVELLDELEQEQARPAAERDETLERELLSDVKNNVRKISSHGQRAAGIVRGMLEHARSSTGDREPTDLNALADEYLKLAYHGLRRADETATSNTVEVSLVTNFAPDLPPVAVVPGDMGRVLMNLCTNAFHAVRDRAAQSAQRGLAYVPTVTLTTERVGDQVRICVRDNGVGMSEAVQQKIFQPFFTTKPTGQGTGLGLSISYDIVTKGHGGTLQVRSEVGVGTEFEIRLKSGSGQ